MLKREKRNQQKIQSDTFIAQIFVTNFFKYLQY